ncbi:MAG TPA: response regulator [Pyrinomonadaceae bacterium]|jgi:CheY-like chemotaxis protein|nr:response regulator [Pyrinomonadaceae bacterium]
MELVRTPRVLYVDNESTSSGFVHAWLRRNAPGCKIIYASSGSQALTSIAHNEFDLYLFEYCVDEMTGPELCAAVRERGLLSPVVICSPLSRDVDRKMAIDAGATEYLIKPDEFYRLSTLIRKYLGPLPRFRNRLFHSIRRSAAII